MMGTATPRIGANSDSLHHSLTCYLNSLLREWPLDSSEHEVKTEAGRSRIVIALSENECLELPLVRFSSLGRHEYEGRILLRSGTEGSIRSRELDFQEFLVIMARRLTEVFDADPREVQVFNQRVLDSARNIDHALNASSAKLKDLYKGESEFDFIASEQALVIGHNFHPTPKSRGEFDARDLEMYSPEFGGGFKLQWLMADPAVLHSKTSSAFKGHEWTAELAGTELACTNDFTTLQGKGLVPVPMHPWQFRVLKKNPRIQSLIETGQLVPLAEGLQDWTATSSLRSIYRHDAPYMLKFSMSVKLTNSVRHLLAREVERGLQLHDVLSSPEGGEFLASQPRFKVIAEPAYFCFKNADGSPMHESIVVCRENPFQGANSSGKAVLATLTQDNPFQGDNDPSRAKNLIHKCIDRLPGGLAERAQNARRWFDAYLSAVVEPLFLAQANYGITLGAHQQNLVLEIREGLPVGAWFRDCQGTGYSELAYSLFSNQVPSLDRANGNILSEKMGNWLFSYYSVLNSTFNVITSIASSGALGEKDLLEDLRSRLENLRNSGVRDESCLDYLLESEALMHKGNFRCSFRNINENTSENPLAIYTPVANSISIGDPK